MSLVIQKLRLQRGWSQQQLADFSGLSVRTVQRIESGQKATAESLKSLAAVFEVEFQELRAAVDEGMQPEPAAEAPPEPPDPAAMNVDPITRPCQPRPAVAATVRTASTVTATASSRCPTTRSAPSARCASCAASYTT